MPEDEIEFISTIRPKKLYHIEKGLGLADFLIFDAGHANGNIHIYIKVSTKNINEIVKELLKDEYYKRMLKNNPQQAVYFWIKKTFGKEPYAWNIK